MSYDDEQQKIPNEQITEIIFRQKHQAHIPSKKTRKKILCHPFNLQKSDWINIWINILFFQMQIVGSEKLVSIFLLQHSISKVIVYVMEIGEDWSF